MSADAPAVPAVTPVRSRTAENTVGDGTRASGRRKCTDREKSYACFECGEMFPTKQRVYKHRLKVGHCLKPTTSSEKLHACPVCDRQFKHYSSLSRHRKLLGHVEEGKMENTLVKCRESDCSEKFLYVSDLVRHLSEAHELDFQIETTEFASEDAYLQWKLQLEKDTSSRFSVGRAVAKPTAKISYLYCNRSGFDRRRNGVGRKASVKIDYYCTAHMVVKKHDRGVAVKFCSRHYGHKVDLSCIRLSDCDRTSILAQLQKGMTVTEILNGIRASVGNAFQRIRLTTKKDVRNIARSAGIGLPSHKESSAAALRRVLDGLSQLGDNDPVLFCRQKGPTIFLQTPFQRGLLRELGHRKTVFVDAVRYATGCDFYLITVFVKDESGEGIPVGWCLSYTSKEDVVLDFLSRLRRRVGPVQPSCVMSIDVPHFYTAWVSAFGPGPKKFLCTWHVEKAWRKLLSDMVRKPEVCDTVYRTLQGLIVESDSERLERSMNALLVNLLRTPSTASFGEVFLWNYAGRSREWAHCYRDAGHSDMTSAAFSRFRKLCFLGAAVRKRLDKVVLLLLSKQNEKGVSRPLVLSRNRAASMRDEIQREHFLSLQMPLEAVTQNGSVFHVRATGDDTFDHTVEYKSVACNCSARCSECNICIHEFSCTCYSFLMDRALCRHMHLVARFLKESIIKMEDVALDMELPGVLSGPSRVHSPAAVVVEAQNQLEMCRQEVNTYCMLMMEEVKHQTSLEVVNIAKQCMLGALNVFYMNGRNPDEVFQVENAVEESKPL